MPAKRDGKGMKLALSRWSPLTGAKAESSDPSVAQ
jgi:hypothetical protein